MKDIFTPRENPEEEVERLRYLLDMYGDHEYACPMRCEGNTACGCGWAKALASLDNVTTEAKPHDH